MELWKIEERDQMRLFGLFGIFYVVLAYINVVNYGLSIMSVLIGPAVFAFWLTFNPLIAFSLFALMGLYCLAPSVSDVYWRDCIGKGYRSVRFQLGEMWWW
ncbi:MAG: hypothetical protein CMI58_01665 [Parcubacteria group bacterium]|nr:hypothetical protein [Parcubacteria group bacterium]